MPRYNSAVIAAPDHVTDSIKRSEMRGNLEVFLMPSVRAAACAGVHEYTCLPQAFEVVMGTFGEQRHLGFSSSANRSLVGIAIKSSRSWLYSTNFLHSFFQSLFGKLTAYFEQAIKKWEAVRAA